MDSVTSIKPEAFRMIFTSRTVCHPMPFNKAADMFLFIVNIRMTSEHFIKCYFLRDHLPANGMDGVRPNFRFGARLA